MTVKAVMMKMGVLLFLGVLCLGVAGCDDPTDVSGVYFENNSSYDVTVYWGRYYYHSYPNSFILEPGEHKEIEVYETSDDDTIYYDWDPKGYVRARQNSRDEIEFLDR